MRHTSHVTRVSLVTCPMSLMTTSRASDPPPVNSHTRHSKLVHKDPKSKEERRRKKTLKPQKRETSRGMPILMIQSSTRSIKSIMKQGFQEGTDRQHSHRHCRGEGGQGHLDKIQTDTNNLSQWLPLGTILFLLPGIHSNKINTLNVCCDKTCKGNTRHFFESI